MILFMYALVYTVWMCIWHIALMELSVWQLISPVCTLLQYVSVGQVVFPEFLLAIIECTRRAKVIWKEHPRRPPMLSID